MIMMLPTSESSKTYSEQLSVEYYNKTCPQLEQLVASVASQQFHESPISGPATIRLFFHDCFVQGILLPYDASCPTSSPVGCKFQPLGCDASVLILSKPGSSSLAEKDAQDNKDLARVAFDSIEKAKSLIETKCPGVVSCADILAIAARDFVHLAGGPYYQVKKGRWDGKVSMASKVSSNIPHANSTVDDLLKLFASKGLSLEDLVVLSGAHTIGFAHCEHFVNRLYNYKGTKKPDPSIDPRLLKALCMMCPASGGNTDVVAPLDVKTPFAFDHVYYRNSQVKMGLLATDQELFLDPRTRPVVVSLGKDKKKFFQAFSEAMDKMGSIGVKRGGKNMVIRRDCAQNV